MTRIDDPSKAEPGTENAGLTARLAIGSPGVQWQLGSVLLLVALAVRFERMTGSIWYDEWCRTHQYLTGARLPALLLHDVHNPLYNALMFVWINVFGDSEISIRLPSLIAGLGTIAAVAFWVHLRFGGRLAWLVAAMLAVNPAHIWYSTEAKNSMLLASLTALAAIALDLAAQTPTRRRTLFAIAALTASLYTQWLAALSLVPLCILLWFMSGRGHTSENRNSLSRIILVSALLISPLLVFKSLNSADVWRTYLQPLSLYNLWEFVVSWSLSGRAIFPGEVQRVYLMVAMTPVVLLCALVGVAWLVRRRSGATVLVMATAPVAGLFVAAQMLQLLKGDDPSFYIYQPRNLLIVIFWLPILLLAGAQALKWKHLRRFAIVTLLVTSALASTLMVTIHAQRTTVLPPRSDWRAIATAFEQAALDAGIPADQRAIAASNTLIQPLGYYTERAKLIVWWSNDVNFTSLETLLAEHHDVFVFFSSRLVAVEPESLDTMHRRYETKRCFTITDVECWLVRPMPGG